MKLWKSLNSEEKKIASILTNSADKFGQEIMELIPTTTISYSGIVISSDEGSIRGRQIEKQCYAKGGFQFLFKAYEPKFKSEHCQANEIIEFLELISTHYLKQFTDYRTALVQSCWVVCQREGDYGTLHNHTSPDCDQSRLFSGMLYLHVPECINPDTFPDGCLHLVSGAEVIYVPPVPGGLVVWPAKTLHGIHPFRGSGDRVGLAFNFSAV